jgi:hypothetical protein
MPKPLVDRIPFVKIITILAVTFSIGLGLCGLTYALNTAGVAKYNGSFYPDLLGLLSLVVMVVSFLGLIVASLAYGVLSSLGSLGIIRPGGEIQRLFDNPEEAQHDREKPPES